MTPPTFGERVREQRQLRGMRQSELVDEGLSTSYVSLLEGGRREPTQRIAEALAGKLGVDVDYLLGRPARSVRQERELAVRFAELALHRGDPREARRSLEQLLASGEDDEATRWAIEHALAKAHERCGDLEAALDLLEQLRARAECDRARWPWLQVVIDLSRCYREVGDLEHAIDVAELAAAQARELGLVASRDYPRVVVTLAGAYRERGDLVHASQLLQSLLASLDAAATRQARGSALWNAAVVAADRGHFADGILLAERAVAQLVEEDDVRADGLLRTSLAWMLLDSPDGDPTRARELLVDARSRLLGAGMQIEAASASRDLGDLHTAAGHHVDAESAYGKAFTLLGLPGRPLRRALRPAAQTVVDQSLVERALPGQVRHPG